MESEKIEEKPPQEQPTTEVPPSSTEAPKNPSELTQEKKDTSKSIYYHILFLYF